MSSASSIGVIGRVTPISSENDAIRPAMITPAPALGVGEVGPGLRIGGRDRPELGEEPPPPSGDGILRRRHAIELRLDALVDRRGGSCARGTPGCERRLDPGSRSSISSWNSDSLFAKFEYTAPIV